MSPSLLPYPDGQIKHWYRNRGEDLLAADPPIVSQGRFLIFDEVIPDGSSLLVKGIVPYAKQRIEVGTAQESFQYIRPEDGNGFFCFEPLVGRSAPLEILIDMTTPQQVAPAGVATPTNGKDRQQAKGFTEISITPLNDAVTFWNNPFFSFVVPGGSHLQVIFELLTQVKTATANPLVPGQGTYAIAALEADTDVVNVKRVDFAGVVVVGELMPSNLMQALIAEGHKRRIKSLMGGGA